MKQVSIALKAHLALETQTLCTCWKVTRTDAEVFAFTDHDRDLVIGGVTYKAASGYTASDVASTAALDVDNLEIDGMLSDDSITEADLHAGLWDHAAVETFMVNWADLTQGTLSLRTGWLGEVTAERNAFKAELRGLTQAYARTLGELTQAGCRAELYDERCKVDPAAFTHTGTLTGVSADGMTLKDSARTEPGPAGGVVITAITAANPGRVTVADASGLIENQPVMLSGILGGSFPTLNTVTLVRNLDLSLKRFDLGISTVSYGTYTASSGTCTPLGSESGYFDFGRMTMTSGPASGLSMEVRAYVPGQWTLELPLPILPAVGNTYTMRAGCDKSLATCITKFANAANMRAEPYLPGLDKIVQIGKQ